MAGGRWNPWRDLRSRAHVRLEFDHIADETGGGLFGHLEDRAAIVISPDLGRRARRAALAHELVHDERRITYPSATDATMELEEARVRVEAALRLVPLDELEAMAIERGSVGPLMAWEVADEFDVPESVAWVAVTALQARLLEDALRATPTPPA